MQETQFHFNVQTYSILIWVFNHNDCDMSLTMALNYLGDGESHI